MFILISGCMERVYINSRLIDLNLGKQHKIGPGCGGEETVKDQGSHMLKAVTTQVPRKKSAMLPEVTRPRPAQSPRTKISSNNIEVLIYLTISKLSTLILKVSWQTTGPSRGRLSCITSY